ncbi:cupin domain-containing protein [Neisseria leonii]|uniref:Cupin domain-containing protein n=1 Tax=Neisseria leonii TaxID=2995413 RepID=A0A9X4IBJ8_9NEIS|nr:cupin domain-containing protein [Neisseria sp. 51.81]MDD9328464.1 cupin domain-containing protein [Neisseria sp. 51.81]
MNPLASLDELPQTYRDSLQANHLVPLWPSMRALLPPGKPACRTQTQIWPYENVRPLLMEAGALTPIEKAERRVLVLANPGHGLDNLRATPSIYLGLQLILPGETAPNHRHTPNAVRIIVEGGGACTTVNGEPCRMARGDLILTPSGMWHEHSHTGDEPVVWLDVLDLPLIYRLEGSWAQEGEAQTITREADKSFAEYSACGMVPSPGFVRGQNRVPMLRYPWHRTHRCLTEMAAHSGSSWVQAAYVNPENGRSLFPSIGFGAAMLRAGSAVTLPERTAPCVFHVVGGEGRLNVESAGQAVWRDKDTFCTPGYSRITLTNTGSEDAFFITADEAPLHEYLGIF